MIINGLREEIGADGATVTADRADPAQDWRVFVAGYPQSLGVEKLTLRAPVGPKSGRGSGIMNNKWLFFFKIYPIRGEGRDRRGGVFFV